MSVEGATRASAPYTAIAMLVSSISIFSSRLEALRVVQAAASSRPNNKSSYARDGSRSRSYVLLLLFSEEERILSALAETDKSYDDYDDEMADYSSESSCGRCGCGWCRYK
jgi:hypothetical protein